MQPHYRVGAQRRTPRPPGPAGRGCILQPCLQTGTRRVTSKLCLFLLLTCALWTAAWAEVIVVECQDADGTVSYRDRCPPGSQQVGSLALGGRQAPIETPSLDELARLSPVTIFRVAECDTCDLVRLVLKDRGVPFSEVDVERSPEAQGQLKAVSGTSRVPTVTVGKEVIAGFDRVLLQQTLDAAGYPRAAAPPASR